ncbi:MAG: hypothetical protein M3176_16420 [Chloroflexota bacterium]|nr:hypothetical protein [Chloroflexota bacterium]
MHRSRVIFVAVLAIALVTASIGAQAASRYANPAFQSQWQQGEAVTPNFWGPLETAKDGQQEAYKEASGGQRLVQYFDKGRMELTNGAVTNGLLATEIITGRIQTGDNSFQNQAPPSISIAGDASNPAPTYAGLASKGASLLQPATSKPGVPINTVIGADGTVGATDAALPDPAMQVGAFDGPTRHNVAAGFADYRAKAGLPTIGYAISEPFLATVKVGGAPKDVMVQIFERRALTYTPSNPAAFKVEMGNIGQHYFAWRYPNGATAAPPADPGGSAGQQYLVLSGTVAFSFPANWKLDTTPVTAGPPRATIFGPGPKQQLVVQIDDQSDPPASLTDILTGYITSAHMLVNGSTTDESALKTTIGGEPAQAYRVAGTRQDGSPVSSIIVVVIHKNQIYSFIALADANPMPNYNDIQAILATVTFQT